MKSGNNDNKGANWNAISSIVAIFALFFSLYQFKKSIDISNAQLELTKSQFDHQRKQDSIQFNLAITQFQDNLKSSNEQQAIINKQFQETFNLQSKQSNALSELSKENISINRPNFFGQIKIKEFDVSNPSFQIEYLFNNFGNRAAINFQAKVYIIPSDLQDHILADITSASEITPKYSLTSVGKVGEFKPVINQIPIYFFVHLTYQDSRTNEPLSQNFYFVWQGIKNGHYVNICENLQAHMKPIVDKYVKENKLE